MRANMITREDFNYDHVSYSSMSSRSTRCSVKLGPLDKKYLENGGAASPSGRFTMLINIF